MPGDDAEPYVGLRPFESDDAGRFFGRASKTREITSLLSASRLVVVHGPPAVGKTSLVRAGVLASMGRHDARVLPVGRLDRLPAVPATLTSGYNPFSLALLSAWADDPPHGGPGLTLPRFLSGLPPVVDRYGDKLPIVAVVDQFEAVFSDGARWDPYREPFLTELFEAVRHVPELRLVLTIRDDVVDELLPYESRLPERLRSRVRVRPLEPDAALAAITLPLQPTGRSFAPGVADELVRRLRTTTFSNPVDGQRTVQAETVEPVNLQVVCSSLWRALPEPVARITAEHLDEHGDVETVLARFCTDAVEDVAAQENVPAATIWRWLARTFITDLGRRDTAYAGVAASTAGMPTTTARAFVERGILRAERRSGSVWFELLHDGLIEPIRRGAERVAPEPEATPAPGTYLRMAEAALRDGMLAEAVNHASRAARGSLHDRRLRAEVELLLGKVKLDQARREHGERADDLWALGERHHRTSAELFAVEEDGSAVGRVLTSLGRMFVERRRFADAVAALQGAVHRLPGDAGPKMDLAEALQRAGQTQAAVAEYGSVLVVAPDTVDALVARGVIDAESGDPAAALADLDNAVRLQPELAERPDIVAARANAFARMER